MHSESSRQPKWAVATLLVLALIAVACGGDDDTGESAAQPTEPSTEAQTPGATDPSEDPAEVVEDLVEDDSTPVPGGTLRVGLEADVDGLNPTSSSLSAPGLTMASAVFDNLTRFDADGTAVPFLAESVEPVGDDLITWRLKLREGVTFHDGTPLDAEAVRVNFETQLANPLISLAVAPFFAENGAIEVIDDLTVEYTLAAPSAVFPAQLASQLGMVASPTWLAAATEDPTLNQEPVGTGPFKLESRSQDGQTVVVRNDDWWGGDVYLDAVEFVPITDPSVRTSLLQEDAIQALHTTDPAAVADLFDDEDLQNIIDENGEETFVQLNTSAPPFDDIRARQALTLATPLTNYVALIGAGVARGADQIFTPESVFYNPDVVQEGDDPGAAAALATEYCADVPDSCSNGKINVVYQFPGPAVVQTRIAEILAEGWASAFNVSLDELVQDTHLQQTVFGQFQAVLWRGFGEVEPSLARRNLLCETIGGLSINFVRYCTEERDALLFEVQAMPEQEDRIPVWQEISQQLHDAYTHIFLQHTVWDTAFRENVRGVCDQASPEGVALLCVTNGRMWFDSTWLAE